MNLLEIETRVASAPTIMSAAEEVAFFDMLMQLSTEHISKYFDRFVNILERLQISRSSSIFEFGPDTLYFRRSRHFSEWLMQKISEDANFTREKRRVIEEFAVYFSESFDERSWLELEQDSAFKRSRKET